MEQFVKNTDTIRIQEHTLYFYLVT